MKFIRPLNAVLSQFELVAITWIFVALVVLNLYAIASRYLANYYPPWIIEISEMLLVQVVFVGGAWLYRARQQIGMTLFHDSLAPFPRTHRLVQMVADGGVLVFATFVLWQAIKFQPILFNSTTPSLGLPKNVITLLVPYAYLSIVLSAIEALALRKPN